MMRKLLAGVLLAAAVASSAWGQSVQQSGSVTPGHVPVWITSGVQGDGGTSADSPLTSLGVTGPFCVNSARIASGAWNSLCLQANTSGAATISYQNYGGASAAGLNYVINGVVVSLPTGGGTFIFGSGAFTATHVPCFLNASGTVADCGVAMVGGAITSGNWAATPVPVAYGGTGGTSQATAQTNLGLGTMATQNANAVAITGGTATGLPTPTNPTDVAIKSYVDNTATGLNILAQSTLATAATLPNSPTYNNGTAGVGATFTAGSNTTLTVDGTAAPLNTVVLVKNQATAANNGVYTVTTAGSGAAPWVLTRASYFNSAATMKAGSYTFITGGATNTNTSWTQQAAVVTVGTDPSNWAQFSAASSGTVTQANITAGTGISVSGTCNITASGTCQITNSGVVSLAGQTGALTAAGGVTNSGTQIQADGNYSGWALQNCTLAVSTGSNLLTVALKDNAGNDPSATSPCNINYRNVTAGTGSTTLVAQTAALSISTYATGATLGTTNNKPFRFWVVAFNNSGTNVLALINCSTPTRIYPLNEGVLASSSAIGGSATSPGVFYTPNGTAVSSVPFRILGYIEYASGLATAGSYSTGPTIIQNFGPGIKKPGDLVSTVVVSNVAQSSTGSVSTAATNMAASITPTSAANPVWVLATGQFGNNSSAVATFIQLFRGTTSGTLIAGPRSVYTVGGAYQVAVPISVLDFPGTVSSQQYIIGIYSGLSGDSAVNYTGDMTLQEIQG